MTPRLTQLHQDDTHRLIPARYSEDGASVLARLTSGLRSDQQHLHDLFQLEGATNERLLGESNLLPGVTVHELVFGIPNWLIVNAAFTHARPEGSRFNGPQRGAWYAAFALETAQAEVAFHFAQSLQEVNWEESETATYREYRADFRAGFHDIRKSPEYSKCLDPGSYLASQQLARELLHQGSAGVIYPSVRHRGGTCLACFRPALVTNVRKGWMVTLEFSDAFAVPRVHIDKRPKKT
ncbi:MAG: RES family NAD+ phosphorylase [Terriglobales bacterium]